MTSAGPPVPTRPARAVRAWLVAAGRLLVGAATAAVEFVSDHLSLVYHVGVVIVSAAIALTLPYTFAFLARRLLASWSAIEDEKVFIVAAEIGVALVLVLVLNHARANWRNRRLAGIARAAGMVHLGSESGVLSRRTGRRLKGQHAFLRDVMIIGSTGFRTLADPKGDLRAVVENCRTAKIMLLDPESRGATERIRTISDAAITRESLRSQLAQTIAFLRALPAAAHRIQLKLYSEPPLWKLAILGDHAWVRHYHPTLDVRLLPEFVFAHRQDPSGLYTAFYQYFTARWNDPAVAEVDLVTDEPVSPDGERPEVGAALARA